MAEHYMYYDSHGSNGPGVYCTCGSHKIHGRGKVLIKWALKHTDKTGHKWKGTSSDTSRLRKEETS